MGEVTVRKNYFSLDIAKFVCAIMILSAHFASERGHFTGIVDYLFSLYIFAVPFFFACSGFLFLKNSKIFQAMRQSIRILFSIKSEYG